MSKYKEEKMHMKNLKLLILTESNMIHLTTSFFPKSKKFNQKMAFNLVILKKLC